MKLPNAEYAFIDMRKLAQYVLDPESPRGRNKARVFKSTLGITVENAAELSSAILHTLPDAECSIGELDFFGQRYTVDCKIRTEAGEAVVRSGWIVRHGEDFPRLTTCFVLKKRGTEK